MKKLLVLTAICITLLSLSYTNVKAEEGVAGISVVLNNSTIEEVKTAFNNNYMWTTDRVNLREQPDINSDIIETLDKWVKIQMISSSDKWIKVRWNNTVGYIYSKYLRDTELPRLDFTDKEIDLIAKIIWLESRGESDEGEAGICIVIINRLLSKEFSDTIYEILSDKNEFTSWKLLDAAEPTEREYEIIDEVLNGEWDNLLTDDTVYFSTEPRNDNITAHIGAHYFCEY